MSIKVAKILLAVLLCIPFIILVVFIFKKILNALIDENNKHMINKGN